MSGEIDTDREEVFGDASIGQNVANLRGSKTQKAIADGMKKFGFKWTQTTVWEVESGKRSLKVKEARALAEVLDTHVQNLLEATAEPAPQDFLTLKVETALRQMRDMEKQLIDVAFRYRHEQIKAQTVVKFVDREMPTLSDKSDLKSGQFRYLRDALQIMIDRSATEVVNANSENQMTLVPIEEYVALVEQADRPQAPQMSRQARHGVDQEAT